MKLLKRVSFFLTVEEGDVLLQAARLRNETVTGLVERLVAVLAKEPNLIDAVLDDKEQSDV